MAELAEALSCADLDAYAHTVGAAADVDAVSHRVRALCDTVIDECTEETVRDRAFRRSSIDAKQRAVGTCRRVREPAAAHGASREDMLVGIYEQQADPALLHGYAAFCTDRLASALPSSPRRTGSVQTRRIGFCTRLRISSTPCTASRIPTIMRIISCRRTRHWPKTTPLPAIRKTHFCVWKKCVKPGFCFDTYPEEAAATSPAVRGERRGRPVPREKTPAQDFLECLSGEPWYDFLRAEQSFVAILRRLEAHSNA